MIDPYSASGILVGFLILFGIVIPVCGVIPKVKEVISYRYLIVICFVACMIAVIVNFSGLDTSTRNTVIIGSVIMSGIYITVRSIEKALYKGWLGNTRFEAEIKKGDASAKVEIAKKE